MNEDAIESFMWINESPIGNGKRRCLWLRDVTQRANLF